MANKPRPRNTNATRPEGKLSQVSNKRKFVKTNREKEVIKDLKSKRRAYDTEVDIKKERGRTRRDLALNTLALGSQKIQADKDVRIKTIDAQMAAANLAKLGNPQNPVTGEQFQVVPTNPWGW